MVDRLEKIKVSPDGEKWTIEVIDEAGAPFFTETIETFKEAEYDASRMGALYQLRVEIIHN